MMWTWRDNKQKNKCTGRNIDVVFWFTHRHRRHQKYRGRLRGMCGSNDSVVVRVRVPGVGRTGVRLGCGVKQCMSRISKTEPSSVLVSSLAMVQVCGMFRVWSGRMRYVPLFQRGWRHIWSACVCTPRKTEMRRKIVHMVVYV